MNKNKQIVKPQQFFLCPLCFQKFNYSTRVPLLFRSGVTYCKECVNNKLHLDIETGEADYWQSKADINILIGWKNLDILSFIECLINESIDEDIKQQFRKISLQKQQLVSKLKDTKTIMIWQQLKVSNQISIIKSQIKQEQRQRKLQYFRVQSKRKQQKHKINLLIKQQKRRGHQIDEEIKFLQKQIKQMKRDDKIKDKQRSELDKVYKQIKKQGLNYNFDNMKCPVKWINPQETQYKDTQDDVVEEPIKRVTKFFM